MFNFSKLKPVSPSKLSTRFSCDDNQLRNSASTKFQFFEISINFTSSSNEPRLKLKGMMSLFRVLNLYKYYLEQQGP